MDLILQLKDEHRRILRIFETIREIVGSDRLGAADLAAYFRELKEVLSSHLDVENKLLYPRFETAKPPELKKMGKVFSSEMVKIADDVRAFFDEYQDKELSLLGKSNKFRNALLEIFNKVNKRIRVEEDILFPAYERYF